MTPTSRRSGRACPSRLCLASVVPLALNIVTYLNSTTLLLLLLGTTATRNRPSPCLCGFLGRAEQARSGFPCEDPPRLCLVLSPASVVDLYFSLPGYPESSLAGGGTVEQLQKRSVLGVWPSQPIWPSRGSPVIDVIALNTLISIVLWRTDCERGCACFLSGILHFVASCAGIRLPLHRPRSDETGKLRGLSALNLAAQLSARSRRVASDEARVSPRCARR